MKIKHLFGIGKTKLEKKLDEWVSLRDRLDYAESKTEKQLKYIIKHTAQVKLSTGKFADSLEASKKDLTNQTEALKKLKAKYIKEGKTEDEAVALMKYQLATWTFTKNFVKELESQKPMIDAQLVEAENRLNQAISYKNAVHQRKNLLEAQISTYELNKDLFEMTGKSIGDEKLIDEVESLLKEKTMELDAERWTAEKVKAFEPTTPNEPVDFDVKEAFKEL